MLKQVEADGSCAREARPSMLRPSSDTVFDNQDERPDEEDKLDSSSTARIQNLNGRAVYQALYYTSVEYLIKSQCWDDFTVLQIDYFGSNSLNPSKGGFEQLVQKRRRSRRRSSLNSDSTDQNQTMTLLLSE